MDILSALAVITAPQLPTKPPYSFPDLFLEPSLAVVVLGGLIGGLLQPIVAKFTPAKSADELRFGLAMSAVLGMAAAGISVYVVANTDTDSGLRLFFFAMLCGLAFPVILTKAVDGIGKTTNAANKEVTAIADQASSNNPVVVAAASEKLKEALIKASSGTVTEAGQSTIAASANRAVVNIAQTVQAAPDQARDIIEQLKEVATVAQSAGYVQTAMAVADQLELLSKDKDVKDNDIKQIAADAAMRIKGMPAA